MNQPDSAPAHRSLVWRLYAWGCQRLYHELAWSYDLVAWLVSAGQWTAWRRLALNCLPAGGRVLEVGFGTGEVLSELAGRGYQVQGIDPSPDMQRVTARKLRQRGLLGAAGRTRGMAQSLPFRDGCFDAVVATFPADYIFDPHSAAEFARVLRLPSGAPAGRQAGDTDPAAQAGGRLVIVGVAVALAQPLLARLLPVFYGWPPESLLNRWQASLTAAGLQPRLLALPGRGAHVLTVVAERVA